MRRVRILAAIVAFVMSTGCGSKGRTEREAPSAPPAIDSSGSRGPSSSADAPPLLPLGHVTALVGASGTTCAVREGAVYCWGASLGVEDMHAILAPERVKGLEGVSDVSVSSAHACAVVNGAAYCWGDNRWGELGDGTRTERSSPVPVLGLSHDVTRVAAGQYHACAIVAGGARCWGHGTSGQVGDGSEGDALTARPVRGLDHGVTSIAVWGATSCAIASGELRCWGEDASVARPVIRPLPIALRDFVASPRRLVPRGYDPACVIGEGHRIRCFADHGEPGGDVPPELRAESEVASLDLEGDRRCVDDGHGLACWARHSSEIEHPVLPGKPTKVVVSFHTYCALVRGQVFCWGSTFGGGLGDGTPSTKTLPEAPIRREPRPVIWP